MSKEILKDFKQKILSTKFSEGKCAITREGLCEFYGIENIRVKEFTNNERRYFENLQAEEINTNLSDWYKLEIWRKNKKQEAH